MTEEPQNALGDPERKARSRLDRRSAAIGAVATLFVVAMTLVPKHLNHPDEISVRNSPTESTFLEPTTTTVSQVSTTTEAPTTTTTTMAPTTTTTEHVVVTTTTLPPTTTTTAPPVTSDPKLWMNYKPSNDAASDHFTGTITARNGFRPGLTVMLNMIPWYPAVGCGNPCDAADVSQAKGYTFTFPANTTSLTVTVPKSDWTTTPDYWSPLIKSYTWDAGSHGQVTSADY